MEDVYQKLRVHLDNTPSGFPETETGVEIRILKQLFTQEEAELALSLVMILEPAEAIAQRAGKDPESVKHMLLEMAKKGTGLIRLCSFILLWGSGNTRSTI